MIIGIVGPLSSGKTTVARILEKKGYTLVSLSDLLRKQGAKDRATLRALGNKLREEHGPGFLMEQTLTDTAKDIVVDAIRNPAEVDVLHKKGGRILLVDADPQLRYNRAMARGKDTHMTFDEFIAMEMREESNTPYEQQLHVLNNLADVTLMNDGSLDDLQDEVTEAERALTEL